MLIRQRRVSNLTRYVGFIEPGKHLVFGVTGLDRLGEKLHMVGFSEKLAVGETVLPAPVFGPVSAYNSNGKFVKHKNQPMETAYRMVEWHWTEWRGRYDKEEMSDFRNVPYKRYPRTFIPPSSIEFQIALSTEGNSIVVTEPLTYSPENELLIIHVINLFLEIFRECEVLSEDFGGIIRAPVRRLNWEILPAGRWPWEELAPKVRPMVERAPEGNRDLIRNRLETINHYGPEFVAFGRAGFRGYVVFGFPGKNLFVLESIFVGNATYVFEENWERLSQMTKAEVLDGNLQRARLVHLVGWHKKIEELFCES